MKTARINFYLRAPKDKKSDVLISIYRKNRVMKSTGFQVETKEWISSSKGFHGALKESKSSSNSNHRTNQYLKKMVVDLQKAEDQYRSVEDSEYTAKDMWFKYQGGEKSRVIKGMDPSKLFDYWFDYIEELKGRARPVKSTINLYWSQFKVWKKYNDMFGHRDIRFSDITRKYLKSIFNQMEKDGYSPKSVEIQKGCISTMINESRYEGIHNITDVHKKIETKKSESNEVSLTLERMNELEKENLEGEFAIVRDKFVLAVWLGGVRRSDWDKFSILNVQDGIFTYRQSKTQKIMRIPLTGQVGQKVLRILEHYETLPFVELNRCTRYMKKIGEKCGWNESVEYKRKIIPFYDTLGTHTARRTFATIMFHRFKLDPKTIMHFTGHSSLPLFYNYVQVSKHSLLKTMSDTYSNLDLTISSKN